MSIYYINSYFPTLFDAIQNSGGINEYSDLSSIKIIRKNSLSKGGGLITKIGDNCLFMISCHVAHDCMIGNNVILGDQAKVMDGSNIGDNCIITANSLIPTGKRFPKKSNL